MSTKTACKVLLVLISSAAAAHGDSLELRNGSLIKGKFLSGTETSVRFQVGSTVQIYEVTDIRSLRFESDGQPESASSGPAHLTVRPSAEEQGAPSSSRVVIPAGTRISVRTISDIDSAKNGVGYRFQASLEQALWINDRMVIPKGADVYGRLEESKQTGAFTGRSELKLELTGIVVNGQAVSVVTGEYEVSGKSKGESTAKRSFGGAAVGSIIGALAGGGKGATIGAGAGAGMGAASELIIKGDQVKIPSETLLDFTLAQSIILP